MFSVWGLPNFDVYKLRARPRKEWQEGSESEVEEHGLAGWRVERSQLQVSVVATVYNCKKELYDDRFVLQGVWR